jgi:hypothetical protein
MAQKYTDPLYDALDADVTAKLGLPSGLLSKIRLNGERSNADQVSEKGAQSVYQVIPETRAALIKKYGVDPYESPEAAAMGAGYLLKESLQRNNGDVASAVGEYIGGTDRANWGKNTRAYINRVMVALNQNSGGSGGSGGGGQRLTDIYEQSKPQGAVRPDTIEQKIFESRLAGHSDADIFKKIKEKDPRYKDSKKSGFTDQQIAEKLGLSIAAAPVAPKPKDYTGNRMEQFTDQAGAALSNAGRVIAGDGIIDGITSIPRAGIGGVQALMTGLGGMATESLAGLYGLGAGAVGAAQGKDFAESATQGIESARTALQPFVPQAVIAPNTANAILGAMAIPAMATEAAGQANFDAYGNPLAAAAVQGLGDTAMAAAGFRGVGKAPTPVAPTTPRPVEPTPQPITEPVGTPAPVSPAARAANSPDAIRDFVTSRQPEPISPESQTRPVAPTKNQTASRTPQGKAFTTDDTPVDFVYDVVPIEAIQKSINADLTQNKAARPDLQPRNRDTDASAAQINEISNKLNPNRLLEAPTFDTGAPTIFGAEAVAGHGRLTAIERRYLSGRGADYKAAVTAKARELGIDPAKFERIENPVLVRRLSDDATAVKVASDSNADTTLKMSVAEQARTDAKLLPDSSKLVITENGEVNIAGSTDFVREFMRSMPTAARGDLMRPDGTLSQAGVRRIQAAIAQKAYNDANMIERINESLDDQGKRISAALVRNAGALVALADDVKAGARVENTLASDLAMAANKYSDIKASGSTVAEYMAQGRLVDDGMTAGALEALQVFGDNARSGKAVSEYIQGKIKEIEDQGNPSQNTLFQAAKEQKEAEAVRQQYEGTPQWMKAPDGTPTKLSEQQWIQVRTPSFKEWFGDWENNPKGASKVVDENGEPLVVYHGSPFGEFNAFTESGSKNVSPKDAKGHYFTSDYGVAQAYGSGQYGGSMRGAQATVYASYLKINNPEYILDNNHRHWYIKQDKKDSLASDGKDGVIYRDSKDTMNDEYIAFDPNQIKSATGNSGAFDGANPNIYMQGNKSASQVIADTIAKQVADTGKFDADYAQAAGELAAAYYKATADALGRTPKQVFDTIGLDVKVGSIAKGANAQISFGKNRHSMVLGEKANASSFIHELGHHFLETHARLADQSPTMKADLEAVMEWGGQKGRDYDSLSAAQKTELHEKFAETFEQYLLTGKAPTAKLKQVFERFKAWMESVYDSLVSFGETNPRAKLSPDITNVLDNMLGNKADARANAAKEAKRQDKADAELLDFKRSAPADGGVSPRQQQSRYNVLRAIGLTVGQIRGGAVTGDSRRMGWDSLLAKSDTEAGRKMQQQMELERDKLREYGDDIVKSTGGTVGAAPEVRGAAILKPLEGYRDWYKGKIREYYAAADQRAELTGGIELVDFQKKLRENSFFDTERMGYVRKGIASWMREQDLVGADGYFRPMSAKQAESLRQYINKTHYHYEISGGIRVLNDLIDNAVFRVLGENMYAEARATNAAYHRIFTDPKGMAALLEADGINRKTSIEKVGQRLAALAETDSAQFRQIVKQLESMPTKALQADAKRAIGEIRAQIAEKLTAFDPTKPETPYSISKAYAPFRGGKLNEIFGKETADKLRNYVAASGVLRRVDPNPSGTASAMQNLKMRGAEVAATGVGTAAGGAMGGLTGATIGGVLGQQLGRKLQNRIIEAADQRAFDKAMSPRQFETMRQAMRAKADKLERSQPVQDAIKGGDRLSDKAKKVLNARILRSAEWKAYFDNLSDADKAKIKQVGALSWLASLGADQE